MKISSQSITKELLLQCPEDKRKTLTSFLPEKEQKTLSELPSLEKIPSHFALKEELLPHIHYSWFLPFLSSLPKEEIPFFFFCLSSAQRKALCKVFAVEEKELSLLPLEKKFLLEFLWNHLEEEEFMLPQELLPPSPLYALFSISKEKLLLLVDFLALFDLVLALRKILDTQKRKTFLSFLSEGKKHFLNLHANYKENFSLPPLGIEKEKIDEKEFHKILHKRGLLRLSFALSKESSDFLWYLCHHLDRGRGSSLLKLCTKPIASIMVETARENIKELLPFIKAQNPKPGK